MSEPRDPVKQSLGSSRDLYEVATWEAWSRLDRLALGIHSRPKRGGRVLLVAIAAVMFFFTLSNT